MCQICQLHSADLSFFSIFKKDWLSDWQRIVWRASCFSWTAVLPVFYIQYSLSVSSKAAPQIWSFCASRAHSFPALMLLCPVHVFISACLNVASPCARSTVSSAPLLFKCQCQRSSEAALCTPGPAWPLLYLADEPICFHSQASERVSPSRSHRDGWGQTGGTRSLKLAIRL